MVCGVLPVKTFYGVKVHNVLVCCYTDHAIDQYLADSLKQGISEGYIGHLASNLYPPLKTWYSPLGPSVIDLANTTGRK